MTGKQKSGEYLTISDYENVFGQHREKILGDIPNYTNIRPIVQISEVVP